MSKKTIYISGPISKVIGGNFVTFEEAQKNLETLGYIVLNPHEICQSIPREFYTSDHEHWLACMRACFQVLPVADVLVTLNDWDQSEGAKMEVDTARRWGFIAVHPYSIFIEKHLHLNF
ncbi:MAG: hypothetical protein A3F72_03110 [Bacteroidetes bacterium RIFCSPLOWO2_12_FULL_35_15]|nr:MAG: hypothetical protein A3F72_03110 [Bacteroidetes bacterium RIFCSPLOWO2_12_FULL_35_15]